MLARHAVGRFSLLVGFEFEAKSALRPIQRAHSSLLSILESHKAASVNARKRLPGLSHIDVVLITAPLLVSGGCKVGFTLPRELQHRVYVLLRFDDGITRDALPLCGLSHWVFHVKYAHD